MGGGHGSSAATQVVQKGMMGTLKRWGDIAYDGMRHMYHGFRLFGQNTKLATKILVRVQKGQAISRRERLLLERATMDLLRLVPFSFFIIVPFGEALIPIALKMNPNLIPSTFETESQGRNKAFAMEMVRVRARTKLLEHATTQIVARAASKNPELGVAILRKAMCGDQVTKQHIQEIARHFNTLAPLGLDRLKKQPRVLRNVAKALGVYKFYHGLLPTQYAGGPLYRSIQAQLDKLKRDDDMLRREGIAMLTRNELEQANHHRGMRWVDNDAALLKQLQDWIELSDDENVPYHTLVFVRPTFHSLHKSMVSLPVDVRDKMMNIMRGELPPHVADNLEDLIAKIEKHEDIELDPDGVTTEELAEKVNQAEAESKRLDTEDTTNVRALKSAREYLIGSDAETVYDDICLEHGEVTVKHFIKRLSKHSSSSSHEISTMFDVLDFPDQAKPLSYKSFRRLWNRLADAEERQVVRAEGARSPATPTEATASKSEVKKEKND